MFWNNVKIALRNLRKNKVFALVNILGLALGLTIYVFGGLLVKYENTHDMFFKNAENIYSIGSIAAPDLNVGIDKFNATFTAVGPLSWWLEPSEGSTCSRLGTRVSTKDLDFPTPHCWRYSISITFTVTLRHCRIRQVCC